MMDKEIMNAPSTNIFVKLLNGIRNAFIEFFYWDWSPLVFVILICVALIGGISWAKNEKKGDYVLVYKVYYTPNNIKEYTIRHNKPIEVGSDRGSNYVRKVDEGIVIQTSAPIEVVKYINYTKEYEY